MNANGYQIIVESLGAATSTPTSVFYSTAVTTPGIDGINSGATYYLDIIAYTTGMLALNPDCSITVRNN